VFGTEARGVLVQQVTHQASHIYLLLPRPGAATLQLRQQDQILY
jgi:hypothetical protein